MRMSLTVAARGAIALAIFLAVLIDVVIFPGVNMVVPFTIPLAIAALVATPTEAAVTAIVVTLSDVIDVYVSRPPIDHWAVTGSAIVIVSVISYQAALQRHLAIERAGHAEAAQHQLQRFLAMISHDLRSPLTVVHGYAEYLEQQLNRGNLEASRATAPRIRDATGRMERLIDDLSLAARIGEGRFELHRAPMDLAQCARQVAAEQQRYASRHRIVVDAPEVVRGSWDHARMTQTLTNLVSNAVKYSPEGGDVRISLRCGPASCRLAVGDRGPGIHPEDIPRLFQPFSRLDPRGPASGSGLGLFITKGIVESHGGRIWVESKVGEGSTFIITLPLDPDARISQATEAATFSDNGNLSAV